MNVPIPDDKPRVRATRDPAFRLTTLFPAAAALALFAACAGTSDSFFGKEPRDFIEVEDISQVPESDPFTMRDLRIENDSLKFTAAYGGGCREHVFTLYAARAKDSANTGMLYVQHNANTDLCRAMINDDSVAFDLHGLRSALDLKSGATLVFPQIPPPVAGLSLPDSAPDSAALADTGGAGNADDSAPVSLTY